MVAASSKLDATPLRAELTQSILAGRGTLVRFTIDDVMAMVREGIIPEDSTTELIDGLILRKDRSDRGGDPMTHGARHCMAVRRLTALGSRISTSRRIAQIQLPVICSPERVPEPDFALIKGRDEDYAERLPSASDVWIVIEAADSSLDWDSRDKMGIYAAAGILEYLIINIPDGTIDHFSEPDANAGDYRRHEVLTAGQTANIPAGPDGPVAIVVDELIA